MVGYLACVNVEALPLQLLLRRNRSWANHPVAVVSRALPQGVLLFVNEQALEMGVRPGMTYAAGLCLTSSLRAGVVSESEIQKQVAALEAALRELTPEVEVSFEEPGVFWLNASGLRPMWPSREAWAFSVHARLQTEGFSASMVVGFTRFGTYALARSLVPAQSSLIPAQNCPEAPTRRPEAPTRRPEAPTQRVVVLESPLDEECLGRKVLLERLGFTPEARDALLKLGVATVGDFLGLPPFGVLQRFGERAFKLHCMAQHPETLPLVPSPVNEELAQHLLLDFAEQDKTRLLFLIKRLIHPLLLKAASTGEKVIEVVLRFELEGGFCHDEIVRPAEPTKDAPLLSDLIRLRLEAVALPAGVTMLFLKLRTMRVFAEQRELFARKPRRPVDAANRALARIRAELGENAVLGARLRQAHLPEARFAWEPMSRLSSAHVEHGRLGRLGTLVRRIHTAALPLPCSPLSCSSPCPSSASDQAVALLQDHLHVPKRSGPYVVSGGWWSREVHREYHFVQTSQGDLLWVYYDRKRRCWYLHGRIE